MFPIAVAISDFRETALISAQSYSHSAFRKGLQSHRCPLESNLGGDNSVSESIVFVKLGLLEEVTRFSSLEESNSRPNMR